MTASTVSVGAWRVGVALALAVLVSASAAGDDAPRRAAGWRLPDASPDAILFWAGSAARKIRPDEEVPEARSEAMTVRAARNEVDAVELVVRPARAIDGFVVRVSELAPPTGSRASPAPTVEVLRVATVIVTTPTDESASPGPWPDPLLPIEGALSLPAGGNQAFWLRVHVPKYAAAGTWRGTVDLTAPGLAARVPLLVTVYDFTLPDRTTLRTAFGFSAGEVIRYHRLRTPEDRRRVVDLYLDDLAAHHLSPYDPAPLDPIRVTWPSVSPPRSPYADWTNARIVGNEVHTGHGALLLYDDRPDENMSVGYAPLVTIPPGGFYVSFWYRTAVPGARFLLAMEHFDEAKRWLSGRNLDTLVEGDGTWQHFEARVIEFPPGARFVRFRAYAAPWTEKGEGIGLVWLDDVSVEDPDTGASLVPGGDFEPVRRTETVLPPDQLVPHFDFEAWDRAMTRAFQARHVSSFRVDVPGLGSGTFFGAQAPGLLGFGEDTPEYPLLFDAYVKGVEAHLREKGWLDDAYVYWFDEPDPAQYEHVRKGFLRLRGAAPGLAGMLTEQVEDALVGGPSIWCCLTPRFDATRVAERQRAGEHAWWYVCTAPKAPYAGLFLDHAAPEMRVLLWQTWKRQVEGLLVWQTDYWTSPTAYPDPGAPQDPYADPMSWTTGYGVPVGTRHPWGNGDGRFLYPAPGARPDASQPPVLAGPVDSIRIEQLRDGIEDYEYLALLRRRLAARGASLSPEDRARYEALLEVPASITESLTRFTDDGEPIERRRDEIARAIEALSD